MFSTNEAQQEGAHITAPLPTLIGTDPVLLAGWAVGGPNLVMPSDVGMELPNPGSVLDCSDLPTRHNYYLALWQPRIEHILADWVAELAVPLYRGCEVTQFKQHDAAVAVELSDGRTLTTEYLVGCDGGRSTIRKQAGIDFPGWEATIGYLIAEVDLAEEPEWGMRPGAKGMTAAIGKLEEGGARMVLVEPSLGKSGAPALSDLREAQRVSIHHGIDIGQYSPERSIVDAFRLRGREGHELGHEALRRWLRRSGAQPAHLLEMASKFPRALTPLRQALEVLL
jgi:2-polyprenyl-6-methoxyphenol hydroxylase-like FAD-dependent oxidoreductase